MNWLQKIAQLNEDNEHDKAVHYFSIGHGDFDEEVGFEPKYIVWTYIGGTIETGPVGYGEGSDENLPGGGTHGTLWGHGVANRTYKGRYEPETGRLSVVKPAEREFFPIPGVVMQALYDKFPDITKVIEF